MSFTSYSCFKTLNNYFTFLFNQSVVQLTIFNSNLYGGGGGGKYATPGSFFCYSSKTVGARLLKLCILYYQNIIHDLVYFLVTRDVTVAMVTLFLTGVWLKKDQNWSLIFLVCRK